MVTYLVKQRYGKTRLHSAEGMQLEAYCSALGKVLLSGLPEVVTEVAGFIVPVVQAVTGQKPYPKSWPPSGPWSQL